MNAFSLPQILELAMNSRIGKAVDTYGMNKILNQEEKKPSPPCTHPHASFLILYRRLSQSQHCLYLHASVQCNTRHLSFSQRPEKLVHQKREVSPWITAAAGEPSQGWETAFTGNPQNNRPASFNPCILPVSATPACGWLCFRVSLIKPNLWKSEIKQSSTAKGFLPHWCFTCIMDTTALSPLTYIQFSRLNPECLNCSNHHAQVKSSFHPSSSLKLWAVPRF